MAKSKIEQKNGILRHTRCYLSGPMDYVSSRYQEKTAGWRVKVRQFLASLGSTVFDPWEKPKLVGLHEYGKEDIRNTKLVKDWTFEKTAKGTRTRRQCAAAFKETMHFDLRMVDFSDFIIAYCPTNIYSVGTPHEIVIARLQHKPVLFVSPPVKFPALDKLKKHLKGQNDTEAITLLRQVEKEIPIKKNPKGIPSLWYIGLVGSDNFFDGFGFGQYAEKFGWQSGPTEELEKRHKPKRPLLPYLEKLNRRKTLPKKWSSTQNKYVHDDDWLIVELEH